MILQKVMGYQYSKAPLRITNGKSTPHYRAARLRKTLFGLKPSAMFYSATVGAGVNATHCPITCPNRLLPRTLGEIKIEIIIKYKTVK